jgi:hypothetical protein
VVAAPPRSSCGTLEATAGAGPCRRGHVALDPSVRGANCDAIAVSAWRPPVLAFCPSDLPCEKIRAVTELGATVSCEAQLGAGAGPARHKKEKAESVRTRPLASFPLARVREESLLLFGRGSRGSRVGGSRGSRVSSRGSVGRGVSGLGFGSGRRIGRGRLGGGFATTSSRENSQRTERDQRTNRHMGILLLPNRRGLGPGTDVRVPQSGSHTKRENARRLNKSN